MKLKISLLSIIASIFISGCCLNFSDQVTGTTYQVGDVITTSGKDIEVKQFQWGNGNWTSSGSAYIDNRNYSRGSGNDIHANNVNLHFLFDYPVTKITLMFGELGGNINFEVNNNFQNVSDLITLDGTTINGVAVKVNAIQDGNNWYGKITLEGDINNFAIGGQELWLDNVCY